MKILICILSIALGTCIKVNATDLETIRKNYDLAVTDKVICKEMINELSNNMGNNVYLAYLGAFQTIWANHIFNPIAKWNTFKKGKANIEKAVKQDPANVEIRFIRLSIQKNCPGFLGYNDNIKEDKLFLNIHQNSITSSTLMNMVKSLLNSK